MEKSFIIPLVIRGQVIEDHLIEFGGRHSGITFKTPDVNHYADQIVLRNPGDIQDMYSLSTDDIIDYLEELTARLSPKTNPYVREALEASMAVSGQSPEMLTFMYEGQTQAAQRASLKERLEAAFGGEPYLEQWVKHERLDRTIRVRAFGSRMVHIIAGNAPIGGLMAVINTVLLRGDCIIKNPSNDPLTATALARTMIDMAPDHPITKHVTVAYWKGGDEKFERRLYRPTNLEKIIAWGGTASMKHIREYIGPGMDLIALDPKNSCSMIGAEAFASESNMREAAQMLARDIGYLNQEGCVNSRMAFIESGTNASGLDRLNRFGKIVYEELQKLPTEWSCNAHPRFNSTLRDEIDGIRYSPDFKVIGCTATEGGVIVSQENEVVDFAQHLSGRVANLIPVDKIEDAYRSITVYTQTVGIYPESLKDKVRDEIAWRGAQRLTTLGCAFAASVSQPHDGMEMLRRMARWVVIEDFNKDQMGSTGVFFGG